MSERNGDAVVLYCTACGMEWARVANGALIVQSRHRGETHSNAIGAVEFLKLTLGEEWVDIIGEAIDIVRRRAAQEAIPT